MTNQLRSFVNNNVPIGLHIFRSFGGHLVACFGFFGIYWLGKLGLKGCAAGQSSFASTVLLSPMCFLRTLRLPTGGCRAARYVSASIGISGCSCLASRNRGVGGSRCCGSRLC